MIESIEKLRESSHLDDSKWTLETGEVIHVYGSEPNDPNAVNWGEQWRKIADEIEAEIESRYMELPVDADGVPIHVGDEMENGEYRGKVTDMSWDGHFWHVYHGSIAIAPCDYSHVKPRTIEAVLADFASKQHGITKEENDALIAECADELRKLMEVDA